MSGRTYSQTVQDAIASMQQRYDDLTSWIDAIDAANEDIEKQSQNLYVKDGWWIFKSTKLNTDAVNKINEDKAIIEEMTANIAAVNSSGSNSAPYADLAGAINDCMDAITTAENNVRGKKDLDGIARLMADLAVITSTVSKLVDALYVKVAIEQNAETSAILRDNGGSYGDLAYFAQQSIGLAGQEASILEDMRADLNVSLQRYNKMYNQADADKNGVHWWDIVFSDGARRKDEAGAAMHDATDMMRFIQGIKVATSGELASLAPDFIQISAMVDQIMKKLTEILSSNLSPADKNKQVKELNGEIMQLFVMVIGLMALVQQTASKSKAENESKMSEATSISAQMGVSNSQAQMKKIEQNLEYAAVMGIIMNVAKYTMMAVATLASPGVGAVAVGMLMIALEASGALKMLSEQLSKVMGQLGADLFIGGMEMIFTMGGGAVLDVALKSAMNNVMKVISEQLATTMAKDAIEAATKSVAHALGDVAANAAKPAIEQAAKEGAEQAAKKVFAAKLEQNGMSLIIEWLQETATGGSRAAERMVEKTMVVAAEEAAQNSAEQAAKIIALGGKVDGVGATEITAQISKAAQEAGNAAAAKAMKMSPEDIARVAVNETNTDAVTAAARRGAYTALYAVGSNNILVDALKASQKDDEKENQALMIILQSLQALLTLVGQLGGSGAAGQYWNNSSTAGLMFNKIANGLTPVATGAEAVAAGSQYGIDMKQASAVTQMGSIQTVLDVLLQMLAPQIDNQRRQRAQHDNQEFIEQVQLNNYVASHLSDNLHKAAQVMQG